MKKATTIKSIFFIMLFLLIGNAVFGQSKEKKALELGHHAITLLDEGKLESIDMLKHARELDPNSIDYREMAYAYYKKMDHSKSIALLKTVTDHKDVSDFYRFRKLV